MITEIGKLRIKWDIKIKSIRERLIEHYENFLIPKRENFNLKIKVQGDYLKVPQINLLITTNNWNYFVFKEKRYFLFPRVTSNSLAEISDNFKTVNFYSPDKSGHLLLYLFPELLYSLILPEFNAILLHACGIKVKNKIFVFLAPPEGGKSTMAKLALKNGLTVLNDDRIILRKINNKYYAFGNPWHGEVENTSSEYGQVKEIFILKKANKNYVKRIASKDMFLNILGNSFYLREDKRNFKKIIEVAWDIIDNIEGYILGFKPDGKIWEYLDARFRRR